MPFASSDETLHVRSLGDRLPPGVGDFSSSNTKILMIATLVSAAISLLVSGLAFYWFMRMKRSFRHRLILFLIIGDTLKAFCYFLYPIYAFSRKTVPSKCAFCLVQGFMLSLAVEASDFAILAIALHSALYILRPPQRIGQGGLYRYRYIVYVLWVILPTLAASLAFTNTGGDSYASAGSYCYLPKRPFWYRLALAWIPRYIIFMTIFVVYSAIYFYVHHKFRGFDDLSLGKSSMKLSSSNFLDSTTSTKVDRKFSRASFPFSFIQKRTEQAEGGLDRRSTFDRMELITSSPVFSRVKKPTGVETADFAKSSSDDNQMPTSGSDSPTERKVSKSSGSRSILIKSNTDRPSRNVSNAGMPEPPETSEMPKGDEPLETTPGDMFMDGHELFTARTLGTLGPDQTEKTLVGDEYSRRLPNSEMALTRMAIQRQLKFLFIYPLIYLILWMIPFINHCLQYSDYLAAHPPFWLQLLAIVSLCIQAGVDALVFSWRERPWRRKRGPLPGWASNLSHGKATIIRSLRMNTNDLSGPSPEQPPTSQKRHPLKRSISEQTHWWEMEGRLRRDSVWLPDERSEDQSDLAQRSIDRETI